MNTSESQKSWLAQGLFLFLFFLIFWTATKLAAVELTYVWILTIALLASGIPCLIGGAIIYGRYKDVYDFEPAEFFGRQSNGKEIRGLLMKFVYWGFLASLSGGTLLALLQTGIIEQLEN